MPKPTPREARAADFSAALEDLPKRVRALRHEQRAGPPAENFA